jgi:signal transduction histidine kinase
MTTDRSPALLSVAGSRSGRRVIHSTIALLSIGLAALLGIVAMTIWLGYRAQVSFEQVIAARDARTAAVELRHAVITAESAERGFVITGNEIYLAPYSTARTSAVRQLGDIATLFAQYPDATVAVTTLVDIVGRKFSEMDEIIALKRARKDADALALIATNRGKSLTDQANVFFTGLILMAEQALTEAARRHVVSATWLRWVSVVAGVVIVLVVGGAGLSILRYTRQLAVARDELSKLNASLEERVRERTAELAQLNLEVQRFAYVVTHDLRAPLVNIMGFTSELEASTKYLRELLHRSDALGTSTDPVIVDARTAIAEDLPEAIGFIRASTRKMDGLINAILKLSREGRRQLRPEPIDLHELVELSLAAIRHQIAEADGTVEVDVNVPTLLQDRMSLETVIGNLLDNAVKYRAADRPLRIAVRAAPIAGDRTTIEISDNGRGIAEQDHERVFELFRRSGPQDAPGEGMGLAHVRAILRNLGGEISLRSVLDEGTTFTIILPSEVKPRENGAS